MSSTSTALTDASDKTANKSGIVATTYGGVRLVRRMKIFFHSEMNLNLATLKPTSAAFRKFRRLGNLGHAEQITVELARRIFPARRHGKLDMIDRGEGDSNHVRAIT